MNPIALLLLFISLSVMLILLRKNGQATNEEMKLYLGSGCLFEIVPTVVFGFLITAAHYIIFEDPLILQRLTIPEAQAFLYMEWFFGAVFSLIPLLISGFVLGKTLGVGWISAVSLGYYAYYLSLG